jgi:hypothetical protein
MVFGVLVFLEFWYLYGVWCFGTLGTDDLGLVVSRVLCF